MLKTTARRLLSCAAFPILLHAAALGQPVASFEVELDKSPSGVDVPVHVDLDAITFLADSLLRLIEVRADGRHVIPHQIESGRRRTLHWVLGAHTRVGRHVFELTAAGEGADEEARPEIRTSREGGSLVVRSGDRPLLAYQQEILYPPDTVDAVFARSGFIHPLWSPHGQELTRIQPPDHYHHYGIWNPWTHVEFEGEIVDFWNLHKHEGTVRFAKLLSSMDGPVYSEFQVMHEHIVFREDGDEEVALSEVQTVRVYRPLSDDHYILDIVSEFGAAGERPVRLLTYRYGGLAWRTTGEWTKDNSEVLTSEGHERSSADSTRARWFIIQGEIEDDYAGAQVMSYPTNYNHPELIRVWPDDMYERGDLLANFSPTKNTDWLLLPGRRYVLRYRFVVFNGRFGVQRAERAWQRFASPPRISVGR